MPDSVSLQIGDKTDADRDGWIRQGPNSHQLTLNFCHENFRASVVNLCFLGCSLSWEKSQQSDTPRLRTTSPSAVAVHLETDEMDDKEAAITPHILQVRRDTVVLPNA